MYGPEMFSHTYSVFTVFSCARKFITHSWKQAKSSYLLEGPAVGVLLEMLLPNAQVFPVDSEQAVRNDKFQTFIC
jgi:hypothetical protein